jgi:hypothetical protein
VLKLSREELKFTVRPGRVPRAQAVSVHAERGGATAVSLATDASWIVLPRTQVETPARVSVRVDPQKLAAGSHQGHVTFTAEGGSAVKLAVTARVGDAPALAVQGDGCVLLEGKLRARAGAGCALVAADAVGVQWTLPGGAQATGSRLYGQFVRRGEFQVLLSSEEGATDTVPVVIE